MDKTAIALEIKAIERLLGQNTPQASETAFRRFSRLVEQMKANPEAVKYVQQMTYLFRNRFVKDFVVPSQSIVVDAQRVGTETLQGLSKLVRRGQLDGLKDSEIEQKLREVFTPQRANWAKTWNRTAQVALNRIALFDNVEGDPLMKYSGAASTERKFCSANLGLVKRKSEWEETLNDLGQSSLYYCGGYNCRHRLLVVEA